MTLCLATFKVTLDNDTVDVCYTDLLAQTQKTSVPIP